MNKEKIPLISVIVPVYKVEKYLPACLDSLLEIGRASCRERV